MSKAILVIDMPSNCNECPCRYLTEGCYSDFCQVTCDDLPERYDTAKPDWCPLREVPQKKEENDTFTDCEYYRVQGYNACIDEILGGA